MGPGDFADAEIDGLPGQDGGEVTIGNHPFTAVPGCAWVLQEPRDPRKAQRLRFRSSLIRFLSSSISGRILLQ
jgi:hypothetical protein